MKLRNKFHSSFFWSLLRKTFFNKRRNFASDMIIYFKALNSHKFSDCETMKLHGQAMIKFPQCSPDESRSGYAIKYCTEVMSEKVLPKVQLLLSRVRSLLTRVAVASTLKACAYFRLTGVIFSPNRLAPGSGFAFLLNQTPPSIFIPFESVLVLFKCIVDASGIRNPVIEILQNAQDFSWEQRLTNLFQYFFNVKFQASAPSDLFKKGHYFFSVTRLLFHSLNRIIYSLHVSFDTECSEPKSSLDLPLEASK